MDGYVKNFWGRWPMYRVILFVCLIILILTTGCAEERIQELVVNSIDDSGEGSLRWALGEVEVGGLIIFDPQVFPPDNPATIFTSSDLPAIINDNITIDASGSGVIINGSKSDGDGLKIVSNNNLVKGLQIIDFANGSGIVLSANAGNNVFGPDNVLANNGLYGIVVNEGAIGNKITGNSIYNNGVAGIINNDQHNRLNAPEISMHDIGNGLVQGTTKAGITVEVFSDLNGQGRKYEGEVHADDKGNFTFAPGRPFEGPRLTAVAIESDGNTSEFSKPTDLREVLVYSEADYGEGTLRWALENAQTGDFIIFDPILFKPDAPQVIRLSGGLPPIQQKYLVIDASNAGVIIDGSDALGEWVVGLEIFSDHVTIQGLQLVNFSGAGIKINSKGNLIGGDRSIGDGLLGQGNLISGNADGIAIDGAGARENQISGNLIGTDISGSEAWGNRVVGIFIDSGASHNHIGPANLIAYNDSGVEVRDPRAINNTITENSIFGHESAGIVITRGPEDDTASPTIFECSIEEGTLFGAAASNSIIEIFSDSKDEGEIFEGFTTADESGAFSYSKGSSFNGPLVTVTCTDTEGKTGAFSVPTATTGEDRMLQVGNANLKQPLITYSSQELTDNRISAQWDNVRDPEFTNVINSEVFALGLTRVRMAITGKTFDTADMSRKEFTIDPNANKLITYMADNGITITYVLTFWDKEWRAAGNQGTCPRFKSEDEIERYLDFVQLTVKTFKDSIDYYEIFNEPDHTFDPWNMEPCLNAIDVEDYIEITRRAIPVIREVHPEAKIVVGSTMTQAEPGAREYLHSILTSDIMPHVDVVAWHASGPSPEYDYWKENYEQYPSLIREIKEIAEAHGFNGKYCADELGYHTEEDHPPNETWVYSDKVAAKYYARFIMMHLGMDVATSGGASVSRQASYNMAQNICTVMDLHQPVEMPVDFEIDYEPLAYSTFRYPNGDRILAFWMHGTADEEDIGLPAEVKFPGLAAGSVTGIDVLHGVEQELDFNVVDGTTIISNLLVKDYPILIKLSNSDMSSDYYEVEGDGFKLIGTPGEVKSKVE